MKGMFGLYRNLKRFRDRRLKSIVGVVSQVNSQGAPRWAVRLNANQPGDAVADRTISVYADGLPMTYGDPLAQVAERAAFKLVIRIVNKELDAHDITAIATYRQGMELLLQVL